MSTHHDPSVVAIDTKGIGAYCAEDFTKALLFQSAKTRIMLLCFEPGQEMPPHHCSFEIVWYVLEGSGFFYIDGEEKPCSENTLIVTPSQTTRGLRADSRMKLLAIVPRIQGISLRPSEN